MRCGGPYSSRGTTMKGAGLRARRGKRVSLREPVELVRRDEGAEREEQDAPVSRRPPLLPALPPLAQHLVARHAPRGVARVHDDADLVGRRRAVPVDEARVPQDEVARRRLDLDLDDAGLPLEPGEVGRGKRVAAREGLCQARARRRQDSERERERERPCALVSSAPVLLGLDAARLGKELREELVRALEHDEAAIERPALGHGEEALRELELEGGTAGGRDEGPSAAARPNERESEKRRRTRSVQAADQCAATATPARCRCARAARRGARS